MSIHCINEPISQPNSIESLTKREKECLKNVAHGYTSHEIAQFLHITKNTVIFHLENAKRKLDARTRCHAVIIALKLGLITF